MRVFVSYLCILFLLSISLSAQSDSAKPGDYNKAYYIVSSLNQGMPSLYDTIHLQTPQGAMEHFLLSARDSNFNRAAQVLNLNLIPADRQGEKAEDLARKLYYVINKKVSINWDELPDRPDGQTNKSSPGNQSITGEPRRNVSFGSISVDGREVVLGLQRLRVGEMAPLWLISSASVENIEILYAAYGPTWIQQYVPAWGKVYLFGLPLWKMIGACLLALICYLIFIGFRWVIQRLLHLYDSPWLTDLSKHLATPASIAIAVYIFYQGMNNLLSIAGGFSPYLYAFLLVIVIGSITWLVMRVIDYAMERLTETRVGDISDEENLESRRLLTNISVARRIITFVVILVGVGVVASQFPALENLGVSMLASAGLATIILGVAAQPILGNIMAGLQIAITKPVRIGDSVLMEGEYGTVEDLRFTYLIVKTWDARRLVVPLKYFVTHPFENWSMNDAQLLKPIVIHTKLGADVAKIRKKFKELLNGHELYEGETEPTVQVVDADKESLEIRCLCPAKDPSTAWDLHCDLRESMYAYVAQLNDGEQLARERIEIVNQRD